MYYGKLVPEIHSEKHVTKSMFYKVCFKHFVIKKLFQNVFQKFYFKNLIKKILSCFKKMRFEIYFINSQKYDLKNIRNK